MGEPAAKQFDQRQKSIIERSVPMTDTQSSSLSVALWYLIPMRLFGASPNHRIGSRAVSAELPQIALSPVGVHTLDVGANLYSHYIDMLSFVPR